MPVPPLPCPHEQRAVPPSPGRPPFNRGVVPSRENICFVAAMCHRSYKANQVVLPPGWWDRSRFAGNARDGARQGRLFRQEKRRDSNRSTPPFVLSPSKHAPPTLDGAPRRADFRKSYRSYRKVTKLPPIVTHTLYRNLYNARWMSMRDIRKKCKSVDRTRCIDSAPPVDAPNHGIITGGRMTA